MTSVDVAETLGTPRERWIGKVSLGRLLVRLGRDQDAEQQYLEAAQTIEVIAGKLTTPGLRRSFLSADQVQAVYRGLGRRPPHLEARPQN